MEIWSRRSSQFSTAMLSMNVRTTTTRSSSLPAARSRKRMEIVDSTGRRLNLEKELFRGGEGSIYPVAGDPRVLSKLYHPNIDAQQQAKLPAMPLSAQLPLLRVAAWPYATLHTGADG